jgi:hypothetical protein
VEPERWLVEEAIDREVGSELIERRRPTFTHDPDVRFADLAQSFDFLLAHSVLSHAPPSMVDRWLANARGVMTTSSVFFATVHFGRREHTGDQWAYPDLIPHTRHALETAAGRHGLTLRSIDWPPPKRQTWVAFVRADGDVRMGDIEPGRVLRAARWHRRLRDLRSHLASHRGRGPAT